LPPPPLPARDTIPDVLSRRADWTASLNQLTLARNAHSGPLLDLTQSNPTKAGLSYPQEELAEALARGANAPYDPDPRGLRSAREALAAELKCDPDDLILTSSTSEAYSYIFKLLTDPGEEIATATPSYTLLEHLAGLELVTLRHFPLEFHRRWELIESHIHQAVSPRTRAIVVVNPNNPTGSYVTQDEADMLARLALPLISDEVFLDYPLDGSGTSLVRDDVLTFTLGGLSKSAGLPHFKLGWIRVSGPGKREALDGLELIADHFLSVATPVQAALPELLRIGPKIREQIAQRTRSNLRLLRDRFAALPAVAVLPAEGGWSAVLRVPRLMTDEELSLLLLERGVLVQPGYFFDFAGEGHLVVSLLTPTGVFEEGLKRVAEVAGNLT
jgi:alanine-synthesizing transaminase